MALPDNPPVPARRTFAMPVVVIAAIAIVVLIGLALSGMLAQGITTIFWEALKAVVLLFWNLLRRF